MKLKSLFLATLAAMAMVSCSNDNDPINADGGNAEKNAVMQFRIGFGNQATTKADGTATGDKEAGLDKEQKFANALLIAAYENGTNEVIVKTIARKDFTPVDDPSTDGKYYQSAPFEVPSGKVKAYVILNPTGISTDGIAGKLSPEQVEAKLKTMKLTTLPADEYSFVMYGASAAFQDVAENTTTQVSVAVDRVVAKLKEETAADKISADVGKNFDDKALTSKVNVTLVGYEFTNLTDKSNLVHQSDAKISDFIAASVFDGETNATYGYANTLGKPAADSQITYCWENENAETVANKGDNITSIIYKAQIKIAGHVEGENVYIYNNTAYNYTELANQLPGLILNDKSTIAEYDAIGIFKYENGICYYRQPILTSGSKKTINRNNVYKLSVKSISSIGYPTTIPVTTKTMMQLYIEVNEWTINLNEFEL